MSDRTRRVPNKAFMERLKELWVEAGEPSERAMARALGISQGMFARWLDGSGDPSLPNLAELADHFGVTMDYLWGRVDGRRDLYQAPPAVLTETLADLDRARARIIEAAGGPSAAAGQEDGSDRTLAGLERAAAGARSLPPPDASQQRSRKASGDSDAQVG